MFDSIWHRPSWEIFVFFAFGIVLATTVCARGAIRCGVDYPRRRPIIFGAEVGAFIGLALCFYFFVSTNPTFDEIDGATRSVWDKARLAGFPTTLLNCWNRTGCGVSCGVALVVQTTIIGAIWGATGLRRCVAWFEKQNDIDDGL
ncbi:MAG: hypothetical protein IKU86_09635 [Thermoguttaceae bacterium]|nr:hypothetical protein [Thermoguttaceae bacterium]